MAVAKSVEARIAEITPNSARELINAFKSTGKVDPRLVRTYADDIAAGRWMVNGTSIVLSKDGKVLDGRARLLACIQAKKSFKTLIVAGIDDGAFETIDAVRKRRVADVLTIRRFKHGRALAAALRIIHAHRTNSIASPRGQPHMVLLDLIEAHPEIRDSIEHGLRAAPLLPHGSGIALHYLFGLADSKKADLFFAQLGAALHSNGESPASKLRKVLEDLQAGGGNRRQVYILAVSIKAWNAFLTGKTLRQLRYSPEREPFPEIANIKSSALLVRGESLSETGSTRRLSREQSALAAKVEMITPERAEQLLSSNTINRGISGSVVEKYFRDMRDGRWLLNGQTIKLTASGQLIDGQHRLEAVKKARRPFPAIVVEGVPEACIGSLDFGHKRSLGEILRDRGEVNTASLASALRWLWMIKHEVVLAAKISPTNGEMLQLLDKYPNIRVGQKHAPGLREFLGSGVTAALHFMFSQKDATKAEEFFERLIDGVALQSTNPVYQLRERLIKIRASHRVRVAEAERVALAIKAWNAYREDRPIQQLSWRTRGAARELLPTVL
jgi:hypothetical protein